jgi:molybdenum cofactor cytidylyltransferase
MISTATRSPGIVVLAAGFSSRLGQPKALARVRGLSLLRRMLLLARSLEHRKIILVLPRNSSRFKTEARGIRVSYSVNVRRADGLSSSVRSGIWSGRYCSGLLLVPVDLVFLRRRELERLISRWRATPRRLVARRIGAQGGTPLVLPRWLYPRALQISGDVGLRDMLNDLPSSSRTLIDLPSASVDVDTSQDLRLARQKAWWVSP